MAHHGISWHPILKRFKVQELSDLPSAPNLPPPPRWGVWIAGLYDCHADHDMTVPAFKERLLSVSAGKAWNLKHVKCQMSTQATLWLVEGLQKVVNKTLPMLAHLGCLEVSLSRIWRPLLVVKHLRHRGELLHFRFLASCQAKTVPADEKVQTFCIFLFSGIGLCDAERFEASC